MHDRTNTGCGPKILVYILLAVLLPVNNQNFCFSICYGVVYFKSKHLHPRGKLVKTKEILKGDSLRLGS